MPKKAASAATSARNKTARKTKPKLKKTAPRRVKRGAKKAAAKKRNGKKSLGKSVYTPEVIERIADLWLSGMGPTAIARTMGKGFAPSSVHYHLENTIRPIWRAGMIDDAAASIERVRSVLRTVWLEWRADPKDAVLSSNVRWAIDREIKIMGHDSEDDEQARQASYRVAGKTPSEVDREMIREIAAEAVALKASRDLAGEEGGI